MWGLHVKRVGVHDARCGEALHDAALVSSPPVPSPLRCPPGMHDPGLQYGSRSVVAAVVDVWGPEMAAGLAPGAVHHPGMLCWERKLGGNPT